LVAAARQTGVLCALTTESVLVDPDSDPFQWGRFNAFPWDTSATLAAKVEGWYSWAPKLRQRIAGAVCRRRQNIDGRKDAEGTEQTSAGRTPGNTNGQRGTFQEGKLVR
jgi:hypothetical protein